MENFSPGRNFSPSPTWTDWNFLRPWHWTFFLEFSFIETIDRILKQHSILLYKKKNMEKTLLFWSIFYLQKTDDFFSKANINYFLNVNFLLEIVTVFYSLQYFHWDYISGCVNFQLKIWCAMKKYDEKKPIEQFLFCCLLAVVTVLCFIRKNCCVCSRYSVASYDIINLNSPKIQGIDWFKTW